MKEKTVLLHIGDFLHMLHKLCRLACYCVMPHVDLYFLFMKAVGGHCMNVLQESLLVYTARIFLTFLVIRF